MACATPSSSHEAVTSSAAARRDRRSVAHCNAQSGSAAAARQCRGRRARSPRQARCAVNHTAHAWPCPCPAPAGMASDIRSWSARASSAGALPPSTGIISSICDFSPMQSSLRACVAPVCKQSLQRRDGQLPVICASAAPLVLGGKPGPVEVAVNAQVDTSRLCFLQDSLRTCAGQAACPPAGFRPRE